MQYLKEDLRNRIVEVAELSKSFDAIVRLDDKSSTGG